MFALGRGSHTLQVWHRKGERPAQPVTIEELLDRVVVCPSGCWLWAGGTSGPDGTGYGRILRPGTRNAMAAHIYVYERFSNKGPVPLGWHVDHVCRLWCEDRFAKQARLCVRPEHLEAVPVRVNMARRDLANGRAREGSFRTLAEWRAIPDDDPRWLS